jgi:isoleucyl-tRNA synthetase
MRLREEALLDLDRLKKEQGLNKATDAEIRYRLNPADRQALEPWGVDLADVVGAGSHSVEEAPSGDPSSVEVIDRRNDYALCARSRKRTPDVGSDPGYPELSARDAAVMRALQSRS